MKTSILSLVLGASALLLAAAPTASVAAQPDDTFSATVKYADLNLASREGAKTMYQRIERTAQSLCGDEPDIREIGARAGWRTCVNSSVDNAVGRLNDPMVAAFNGGRSASPVKLAQTH
jgi:UrcA family protein